MPRGTKAAALVLLGALALAACSSSSPTATATQAPAAPTAAPATPAPTAAPASAGTSEQAGQSIAIPSIALPSGIGGLSFHQNPDLEAKLPSKLGNATLQKFSFKYDQLAAFGGGATSNTEKAFGAWLGLLGKSPSDVSVAVASDPSSDTSIGVLQIAGADASKLMPLFQQAAQASGATLTPQTIGNKQVVKYQDSSGGNPSYVYTNGDMLFFVSGSDAATLALAFAALP